MAAFTRDDKDTIQTQQDIDFGNGTHSMVFTQKAASSGGVITKQGLNFGKGTDKVTVSLDAADQIGVDDGDLSGVLDLPDDLRDIADIAVKHEYGLDIGAQALRQPLVVAHSGDNGVALQGFIKSLFQILFRLSPNSGFQSDAKRA